jgi:galactose mutarotase-like enzyme
MLFYGEFNIKGEVHKLYTNAECEKAAFHNFIHQLAKILKMRDGAVRLIFEGKDNYRIKKR